MEAIQKLFDERINGAVPGWYQDMIPHMQHLRDYARTCDHCTEFGVRTGQSSVALTAGMTDRGGGRLVSYDICERVFDLPLNRNVEWEYVVADTFHLTDIAETDLLFMDTIHNSSQVTQELTHAHRVKKYILFHDVIAWGSKGENGEGINHAIFSFLARNPEWIIHNFFKSEWGLLAIKRIQ